MFDIGNALHCVSLKALLSYGLQCFSVVSVGSRQHKEQWTNTGSKLQKKKKTPSYESIQTW